MKYNHIPVLAEQVARYIKPVKNKTIIDATVGLGGHSLAILKRWPDCQIIGIDRDNTALKIAKQKLVRFRSRIKLIPGDFANLEKLVNNKSQELFHDREIILGNQRFQKKRLKSSQLEIGGILFDLGISSFQLDQAGRGFSFKKAGWLDMRMDRPTIKNQDPKAKTAKRVINNYSEERLTRIIRKYGEERWAKRISREISRARKNREISTTTQLAGIIRRAIPRKKWPRKIDPATKTFQAIRIEVNDELRNIGQGLDQALKILSKGGRILVISYHSLEDRIVKRKFRYWAKDCICPPDFPVCRCNKKKEVEILTKKPIRPTKKEVELNPRSRSAKLRAIEKII